MKFYCSNCGLQLRNIRKAVPKFGTVLDLIEPHECLAEPINPMEVIAEAPLAPAEMNKFVESLNELKPPKSPIASTDKGSSEKPRQFGGVGTDDLRDRRFDNEKIPSTAPSSVLDQIKSMTNSLPAHDLKNDADDAEMGG